MKLGVPWSVKGIRPEARETAREAARRSGMSLGDWLNSVILHSAADIEDDDSDEAGGEDVSAVHAKLDDLTRRIDRLGRSPEAYAPPHIRNDFENRASLTHRLEHYAPPGYLPQAYPPQAYAPAVYAPPPAPHPLAQPSYAPPAAPPPAWSAGLNNAVAEIAARRRSLNGETAPRPVAPAAQPPMPQVPMFQAPIVPAPVAHAPAMQMPAAVARAPMPAQDLSGLEEQLRNITDRIDTLRTPGVEDAINALRSELAEIGNSLNDAVPRQSIDTIERQIQSLSQRIAEGRQAGVDGSALAGIEHGLAEVRDALYQLTPAESLVGFNEAIHGLADKIDLIVAQRDPAALDQLESAINTLRQVSTHVASNETVSRVASDVAMLAEKIDRLAHSGAGSDALSGLEQRISALSDALASRSQSGAAVSPQLETLVHSLTHKIEQLQLSRDDNVAFSHLEDRIVKLVEKLDASDSRLGHLEAVERGLGDLLIQMSELRAQKSEGNGLRGGAAGGVDTLKQDIARTQSEIEAVHGTLGKMVDRLALIEQSLGGEGHPAATSKPIGRVAVRAVADQPVAVAAPAAPAMPALPPAPQMPMPASRQASVPDAPLDLPSAAIVPAPQQRPSQPQPIVASPPLAPPAEPAKKPVMRAKIAPINPDLPPDLPLEPGTGAPHLRADAAARIAASEAALGNANPPAEGAPDGKSGFIAAARRAAQAAMRDKSQRPPLRAEPEGPIELADGESSTVKRLSKRIKSLFVAASVIAIVIGGLQIGSRFFPPSILGAAGGKPTETAARSPDEPAKGSDDIVTGATGSSATALSLPGMIPPISQYGISAPASSPLFSNVPDTAIQSMLAVNRQPPNANPAGDTTATISRPGQRQPNTPAPTIAPPQTVSADDIPIAIGGPLLRKAAASGDAGAAYEIAVRYADGRGVPANPVESARWFERAANQGLAAAQFRLGSLYEKGQGVKKDIEKARQNYLAAAAQGNAKAMHNLAVLYAEGIGGKPDFKNATQWFQKAAARGIADSQYNLAVLYARGLGSDKDMAESYKWFALAAIQGDKEAARKRDEVGTRLDPKDLAAVKQTLNTWTAEPQPAAATAIPAPAGGWDVATPAQPRKPKSTGPITLGAR